jgi:hypothetical protein
MLRRYAGILAINSAKMLRDSRHNSNDLLSCVVFAALRDVGEHFASQLRLPECVTRWDQASRTRGQTAL